MAILQRRGLIVIVLLGLTAILAIALNVSAKGQAPPADLQAIPLAIDDFIGVELPVEESVMKILETPNILMRDYVNPDGLHIMIAIVYYEQYRVDFHMPEGCMVGRGSVITDSRTQALACSNQSAPLLMNSLVLKQRTENEHVLYYYLVNDLITPSYPRMRLHLMTQHLMRKPAGAALVRFSVRMPDGQVEHLDDFKDFVVQMTSLLPSYLTGKAS